MRKLRSILGLCALGGYFMAMAAGSMLSAQQLPGSSIYASVQELFADRLTFSSGMDQTQNSQTSYGTADFAFTAPHKEGWRLKLFGSHTQFQYSTKQVYCAASAEEKKSSTGTNFGELCNDIADNSLDQESRSEIAESIAPFGLELEGDQIYFLKPHQGMRYEFAVMPGYQLMLEQFVIKTFGGIAYQHQSVFPADGRSTMNGGYWGMKGAVEIWSRLGDHAWLSADGSYFVPTRNYSGSVQLGYELLSWLTIGPQFAAFGDLDGSSGRAGGFLKFNLMDTETTIAAGLSSNYKDDPSLFGSANMFVRF